MMTYQEFFAEAKRLNCRIVSDDPAEVRAAFDAKDAEIARLRAALDAKDHKDRCVNGAYWGLKD